MSESGSQDFFKVSFQIRGHIHKIVASQFTSPLSPVELLILHSLNQLEGTKTTELARSLGLPTSTMTNILDRLERKGLLERIRDNTDRRVVFVRLKTCTGQMNVDLLPKLQAYLEDHFPELPPEWWCHLTEELVRLEKLLREEEESDTN
ncbi:MAG: MarR family transcriptional regulator [Desulfitobacteriaceae bacterium]